MPLAMFDLDNTLIDRDAAFRSWAAELAASHGGGPSDIEALVAADHGGYGPKATVALVARERFGLAHEVDELVERFRNDRIRWFELAPGVIEALQALRAAGWLIVVVTNGGPIQEAKIRATGVDRLVDAWCVSSIEGVSKPDREIFERAAERMDWRLTSADWMVGDHPEFDIGGGRGVGVATAWIANGRDWPVADWRPTIEVDSVPAAVDAMLQASHA